MLRVDVNLIPHGIEARRSGLGSLEIFNAGAHYVARWERLGWPGYAEFECRGGDAWDLVEAALKALRQKREEMLPGRDSNPPPAAYQAAELPDCSTRQGQYSRGGGEA